MATSFDRWEKDPFFAAAEEVQESSDRMESVYRRWIQEKDICDGSNESSDLNFGFVDVSKELHTALGTAKWQLEELERAIESTDVANLAGKDTRTRHSQFVSAIRSLIDIVENSLKEASTGNVEKTITWVNLDKQERDELALFLSCPSKEKPKPSTNDARMDFVKDLPESSSSESRDGRTENKHRRFLSADANIGSWKINIPSEGEDTSEKSSDDRERPNLQLPKILSFSGLNGALEMKPRGKWYKSGGREGKGRGRIVDLEASIPLKNNQANLVNEETFCESSSRNCLSTCGEENCEKEINGWVGAFHRQIQRSQYQLQYGRPIQVVASVVLALLLIFVFMWSTSS
ncbi:syntaxin/t-SNARE family protein [Carex rostrata]